MPVEIGSFDVIIGMDWLARYHAVIVCDEKLVRVPFGDKTLIFHGDGSNNGHKSRLNIISCTKAQKYLLEGCPIFLAQVTMKRAEDKSKEKRLEEVQIVQDFPEVFPEDLWFRVLNEGVVGQLKELFGTKRLYKDPCLNLGELRSSFVKKKDGFFLDVH
ncbi:hypothetical protein Tco_0977493 [Tanacetum coccineum]|uniref:Reverse transcriptase domain-containing protein n=1 Tax=Tanacetum coccineum TaxID=301880 RepID=A0ABQ5EK85_9ASTR